MPREQFPSDRAVRPSGDWPAFPMFYQGEHKCHTGISARDHACIELRVPSSAHDWLNDLIRVARAADIAEQAFLDGAEVAEQAFLDGAEVAESTSKSTKLVDLLFPK